MKPKGKAKRVGTSLVRPPNFMHFVYIIKCSDNSYYTGYTTNVDRRLNEHNAGSASKITRSKLPVFLVHRESYKTKSEALKREAQIKSWPRARKEELIKDRKSFLRGRISPWPKQPDMITRIGNK